MSKQLEWLRANLTKEKIANAAKRIFAEEIPSKLQSTDYDIWVDGKPLPPIYLVSEIYRKEEGESYTLADLGNVEQEVFRVLNDVGYEVLPKWVGLFQEIAEKLDQFDHPSSKRLPQILIDIGMDSAVYDKDNSGNRINLTEMDPFTFLCCFTRYGNERRSFYFNKLKSDWVLKSIIPKEYPGLPTANPQNSWLFSYSYKRKASDVPCLWRLYRELRAGKVNSVTANKALNINGTSIAKLSEVLFYFDPFHFFPLNGPGRSLISKLYSIDIKTKDYEGYNRILIQLRSKTTLPFANLSKLADDERWNENDDITANTYSYEDKKKYWLYAPGERARKWDELYELNEMAIGWDHLGDLRKFISKDEVEEELLKDENEGKQKANGSLACFEFASVLSVGDVVIAQGKHEYLGWGVVTSDYFRDESKSEYQNRRRVSWKNHGEWKDPKGTIVTKTLTDITNYTDYVKRLKMLLNISEYEIASGGEPIQMATNIILYGPPGTGKTFKLKAEDFERYTSRETSLTKEQHFNNLAEDLSWWQVLALALMEEGNSTVPHLKGNRWVKFKIENSNSKSESNTIWQNLQSHSKEDSKTVNLGYRRPPLIFDKLDNSVWTIDKKSVEEQAQELLQILDSIMNFQPNPDKEIKRYVFTTFHQSYAYEDFIEGIKPVMNSDSDEGAIAYEIQPGVFKRLCERAEKDLENRYAIFIDEINRGNIAQIFGELITLIEPDKRAGRPNSLSTRLPYSKTEFSVPQNIDIFGTMNTADRSVEALDTALRRRFSFIEMPPIYNLAELDKEVAGVHLAALLETINHRIEKLLDKDHLIGHAYFIGVDNEDDLARIFNDKIVPLLQKLLCCRNLHPGCLQIQRSLQYWFSYL